MSWPRLHRASWRVSSPVAGDPEADVLAAALAGPVVAHNRFVVGPLAVARVELGFLDGSLGAVTDDVKHACDLTAQSGHVAARSSAPTCGG